MDTEIRSFNTRVTFIFGLNSDMYPNSWPRDVWENGTSQIGIQVAFCLYKCIECCHVQSICATYGAMLRRRYNFRVNIKRSVLGLRLGLD